MIRKLRSAAYRTLRWSESYTGTDMVYLAKGGIWMTITQFVTYGGTLALAIAFANLVPKEVYGEYKYIMTLSAMLASVSLTGLSASIIQAVARGNQGELRAAFRHSMVWSIPMTGIGLAGSMYYFWNANVTLGASLLIIAIASPLFNSAILYQSYLNGIKDFRTLTAYTSTRTLIPIPFLIGTMLVTHSVIILTLVYFITNTGLTVFFYYRTLSKYKPNTVADPESRHFGGHMSAINFLGGIAVQIDSFLVFHYLGAAELAIYSFAIALPEQIRSVLKNLYPLLLPVLATRSREEVRATMTRTLFQLALLGGVFTILYIVAAPYIYALFFPKYLEAVRYSQVYALLIASAAAAIFPATLLQVEQAKKKLYTFSIIGNVVTIAVLIFAAANYGIMGVVIARVGTELFRFLLITFLAKI